MDEKVKGAIRHVTSMELKHKSDDGLFIKPARKNRDWKGRYFWKEMGRLMFVGVY